MRASKALPVLSFFLECHLDYGLCKSYPSLPAEVTGLRSITSLHCQGRPRLSWWKTSLTPNSLNSPPSISSFLEVSQDFVRRSRS
ncbi:hypothetical protein B0H19DRAFT_1101608 [Mycena capillaripes]|nr:hypothetical protein B0H19DRAFT_1101608 [Mycena capillaripes]